MALHAVVPAIAHAVAQAGIVVPYLAALINASRSLELDEASAVHDVLEGLLDIFESHELAAFAFEMVRDSGQTCEFLFA